MRNVKEDGKLRKEPPRRWRFGSSTESRTSRGGRIRGKSAEEGKGGERKRGLGKLSPLGTIPFTESFSRVFVNCSRPGPDSKIGREGVA